MYLLTKLYIPSTFNIDLIFWQLLEDSSWNKTLNHGLSVSLFKISVLKFRILHRGLKYNVASYKVIYQKLTHFYLP